MRVAADASAARHGRVALRAEGGEEELGRALESATAELETGA